ncbi:hypothetical protein ACFU7Y_35715 [Kitasatospora sp. NPDC057542]|uniref:hypothetical protein n=1 Tax=Kitasatospora sp. NPDC057542 TaxID=3346162 RepID=UPI003681D7EC
MDARDGREREEAEQAGGDGAGAELPTRAELPPRPQRVRPLQPAPARTAGSTPRAGRGPAAGAATSRASPPGASTASAAPDQVDGECIAVLPCGADADPSGLAEAAR